MKGTDRVSTADLINALCEDDEKGLGDIQSGNPYQAPSTCQQIEGIRYQERHPRFRLNGLAKGYEREHFEEAFSRYIPCAPSPFF